MFLKNTAKYFFLIFATFCFSNSLHAEDTEKKEKVYTLESIQLVGTTRLTAENIADALNLSAGTILNDSFVLSTKAKLFSLGLFRSAVISMKKGSRKGLVQLVIEVEDDEDVLSDWAIGGLLGVTQSENQFASGDLESSPLGYNAEIISRNLFGAMHRGSMTLDVDGEGFLSKGILRYGLPRFAEEDVQFDAEVGVTDVRKRYMDTMGFGGWTQGLWTASLSHYGQVHYGVAMYVNTGDHYDLPEFPNSVAGPKIGFYRETRLKSFTLSEGYHAGASILVSPVRAEYSLLDINLAKTFNLYDITQFTIDAQSRNIGSEGYSVRAGTRFDFPFNLGNENIAQSSMFIHLRSGKDRMKNTELFGSAATFGLRFHSSGFIAEFALKITRLPKAFENIKEGQ